MSNHNNIIHELQNTGKFLMEKNLAWGTSGNISAKIDDDNYYITASGTYMGRLGENDFVEMPDNREKNKRPSKEFPMHSAIYKNRPEINAVIHCAPFYSTLLACTSIELPSNFFVETMYYLERITRIRYEHPGSQALADELDKYAKSSNIFLLENHGVVVCDVNINEALMSLQTLEFAARMLVKSLETGISIDGLSQETVQDFLDHAGYKKRRVWPDN